MVRLAERGAPIQARAGFRPLVVIVPLYMTAIAVAEAVARLLGVGPGAIGFALLILLLLNHFIVARRPATADRFNPDASAWFTDILPLLAIVPIWRLVELTLGVRDLVLEPRAALTGLPLLLALVVAGRLLNDRPPILSGSRRASPTHIGLALSGLPLGCAAFFIVRPPPAPAGFDWQAALVGTLLLTLCSGLAQETLFRGLLQRAAAELLGPVGLAWTSALFAAMHIGSQSLLYVLFAGFVGLFFGWAVHRSGSLWPVICAHGLLAGSQIYLWPAVFR